MLGDLLFSRNLRLVEADSRVLGLVMEHGRFGRVDRKVGTDFGPRESVRASSEARSDAALLLQSE